MPTDLEMRIEAIGTRVPAPSLEFLRYLARDVHQRARRAGLELGMTEREAEDVARVTTMTAVLGFRRAIDSVARQRAFAAGQVTPN